LLRSRLRLGRTGAVSPVVLTPKNYFLVKYIYMSFLIHIKDLLNNKEFIYSTELNLEGGFRKFFESLPDNQNLQCNITDTFCEIFKDTQITNAGWVWNSTESKREVLYILSLIEVYNTEATEAKVDAETQTSNKSVSAHTQTNEHLNMYDCSKNNINFMDFNFGWENNYENNYTNTEKRLFDESTFPRFKVHKFWSEELIEELKEKLNKPNLGLNNGANGPRAT